MRKKSEEEGWTLENNKDDGERERRNYGETEREAGSNGVL